MNEESVSMIDKVLAENIEKFSGALGSAVDFTLDQAPEIIQQAIYWNFIESIMYNLIGITLIIPIIFVCKVIFDINNSAPEKNDSAKSNKYWDVDIRKYEPTHSEGHRRGWSRGVLRGMGGRIHRR